PTGAPKAPSRGNTSRAAADALRALCEEGRVPTEQVAEGLLIEHATLTGVAAQRGVPPSKLLRLLQFQPDFKAHPRGLVLLARA
ncbi:MAG: relaxase, partial [Chromatiaceae bacterium]